MKLIQTQSRPQHASLAAGMCTLLLILLCATQPGIAQQTAAKRTAAVVAPTSVAKPVAAEEETAAPNKAGSQGIKIHGHWVLQVKNADGTLGERREFENSLVTGGSWTTGSQLLAFLLNGYGSSGGLGVALITGPASTTDSSTFCQLPSDTIPSGPSQIFAPAGITCNGMVTSSTSLSYSYFRGNYNGTVQTTLTSTTNLTPTSIVLAGNFTVPPSMPSPVTAVQTYMSLCTPANGTQLSTSAPSQCIASGNGAGFVYFAPLTSTTVAPLPLAVTAGQIIAVSVTLSFS